MEMESKNPAPGGPAGILTILQHYYSHHLYLDDHLHKLNVHCDKDFAFLYDTNVPFRHFLKTTILCSRSCQTDDPIAHKLKPAKPFLTRRELFAQICRARPADPHRESFKPSVTKSKQFDSFGRDVYAISGTLTVEANDNICWIENTRHSHWKMLHKRLGDDILFHLFTSFSIFVASSDNVYVQAGGVPIASIPSNVRISEKHAPKKPHQQSNASSEGRLNVNHHVGQKRKASSDLKSVTAKRSRQIVAKKATVPSVHTQYQFRKEKLKDCRTVYVRKSKMLYSKSPVELFPASYVLHKYYGSNRKRTNLTMLIFSSVRHKKMTRSSCGHRQTPRSFKKPIFGKVREILRKLTQNHKKLSYHQIINHYCPVNVQSMDCDDTDFAEAEKHPTLKDYQQAKAASVAHYKVFLCMKAICKALFPKQLFGSKSNSLQFIKHLKTLLYQQRNEKMAVRTLLTGIKTNEIPWLQSSNGTVSALHFKRNNEKLSRMLRFIINKVLLPILSCFFYVTEDGKQQNKLLFYRKETWQVIQKFAQLKLKTSFSPKSQAFVLSEIHSNNCLGVSNLKILPKATSVRPIMNMTASAQVIPQIVPVNVKLTTLFSVLSYERQLRKDTANTSVFGIDDVYNHLRNFIPKNRPTVDHDKWFFVSVDVASCYDSIPHQLLLDIMDDGVFSHEDYLIRSFQILARDRHGDVRASPRCHVSPGSDCLSFLSFAKEQNTAFNFPNSRACVISSPITYNLERRSQLQALLQKHITRNYVHMGKAFYKQTRGIPQGSKVSSLLCDFFFSHLEKGLLERYSARDDTILMRWVDDSLLITKQESVAVDFIADINKAVHDYGCSINPRKTLVNFVAGSAGNLLPMSQGRYFPWCGLLFNTLSLDVQANYNLYSGSLVRDAISVDMQSCPGLSICNSLVRTIASKAKLVLTDPELNSEFTILLNIYQAFVFAAKKFHILAKRLPKGRSVNMNVRFFLHNVIMDLPHQLVNEIRRKLKKLKRNDGHLFVQPETATRLCLLAFCDTLCLVPSCYPKFLQKLDKCLRKSLTSSSLPIDELRNESAIFRTFK